MALALAATCAAPAQAAGPTPNTLDCTSVSYACTTDGYSGTAMGYTSGYLTNDGHNCTMYAAYKVYLYKSYNSRYAQLGDASTWASRARAIPGVRVSTTPHALDVAQWNFGHVAWVESVQTNSLGQITGIVITDDNFNLKITTRKTLHPGATNYLSWPDNFITFPAYGGGSGGPIAQLAPLNAVDG